MNIYFIGKNKYKKYKNAKLKDAYDYLKDKDIISVDIETTRKFGGKYKDEGLDPKLSEIVMIQLGDLNRQYIIDYRDIKTLGSDINSLLTDKNKIKVGQNIKFEYKHLLENEGIRINNLYDTMIAEQILYCGLPVRAGLKDLNKKYLGIEVDKSTRLEFARIGTRKFTEKQIEYGAEDIVYPLKIREFQLEKLDNQDLQRTMALEMLFLPVIADIEFKGIHFNRYKWLDYYNRNLKIKDDIKKELDETVKELLPNSSIFLDNQMSLFSSDKENERLKLNISWDSPQQVANLFKELGICPKVKSKYTGKVSYTVDATVLNSEKAKLLSFFIGKAKVNREYLIEEYLKYKVYQKACTTYGKDFLEYVNPITNRIHSNYKQILNTGRISSSNPNLQNIPADISYRKCFDTDSNHLIINADYSGQEQIILVNNSLEPNLIEFYREGHTDMHSYVARLLYPKKLGRLSLSEIKSNHSDLRQIAKAAGFAINYGGTGYTISKNLGVSTTIGDNVYDSYFKAFPELKKYFKKQQSETIRRGYILIDNLTRRKSYFKKSDLRDSKAIGKIKRTALNFPIQGTAGSITKLAAILYRDWILKNNLEDKVFITNLIHDEINVEVSVGYEVIAANKLEKCMKQAGKHWCKTIELKADASIGSFWYH